MEHNRPKELHALLNQKKIVVAPGVFDGLSARLAEQADFSCLYASGGAISRSAGFPDIGLLSFTEVLERLNVMTSVTTTPIVADADTGFGNEINVRRTIQLYEQIGIAGCHIEDQTFPKRCGHLNNKTLIDEKDMLIKINAAANAKRNDDFLLIARTDAIAVEGLDRAIERANAYAKAGADMIFVEAPTDLTQIEAIAKQVKAPKLINMFYGGKTPVVPLKTLETLGYQLVIIPSDLQRAAIFGMQNVLRAIHEHGDSSSVQHEMTSFAEREHIIGTDKYLKT